jgi:hypothetical protein
MINMRGILWGCAMFPLKGEGFWDVQFSSFGE